jgi:hypothetical protein
MLAGRLGDMPPEANEKGSKRAKTRKGKRRKATEKKPKQAYGELKSMIGMPLDVLSEVCERRRSTVRGTLNEFGMQIASHLHPLDLLQLSRVSADFRAIFTSRSALYMWTAARRNVPLLPDCPDDLSEMEYARLMFETDCEVNATPLVRSSLLNNEQACGRIPRIDTSFTLRLRMCKQCYEYK